MITIEQFRKIEHQNVNQFHRQTGVRIAEIAPADDKKEEKETEKEAGE